MVVFFNTLLSYLGPAAAALATTKCTSYDQAPTAHFTPGLYKSLEYEHLTMIMLGVGGVVLTGSNTSSLPDVIAYRALPNQPHTQRAYHC